MTKKPVPRATKTPAPIDPVTQVECNPEKLGNMFEGEIIKVVRGSNGLDFVTYRIDAPFELTVAVPAVPKISGRVKAPLKAGTENEIEAEPAEENTYYAGKHCVEIEVPCRMNRGP